MKWTENDLQFIETVKQHVRRQVGASYEERFAQSDFLTRFQEEPLYIYHFDEAYWAQYIVKGDEE